MPAGLFQMLAKMVTGQTLGERALRSATAVSALAAVTSGHRAGTWGTLRKGASLCVCQITRGQENSEFLFLNACSGISHKPLGLRTKSIPGSAASLTGTCQSEQPEGAKRSLFTNAKEFQTTKILSGTQGRLRQALLSAWAQGILCWSGRCHLFGRGWTACVLDATGSRSVTTQGPGMKMELMVCVWREVQAKKQNQRKRHVGRSKAT